ncbi:MAG TPA: c-type cytochrome, partial [Vicinamibacteria bacterium]|nr:c-type cytochrome [Vicinamibacteria bacterium]
MALRLTSGVLTAALTLGCASSRDSKKGVSELSRAPARSERKNPFEGQEAAVRAGQKLCQRHCAECHGRDADGRAWAPSLRTAVVESASAGALEWFLRNGALARGMPS